MSSKGQLRFQDWYCEDCMEWTNERGDDCHIGHEIIVSYRKQKVTA